MTLGLAQVATLGKDLREERGLIQLVKHKEYRIVFMLYILVVHEKNVRST